MICAGIDVGSTYTKAVILEDDTTVRARAMNPTGFKLAEVAERTYHTALAESGLDESGVDYVVATGFGRHQVLFKDVHVTDLTAGARGAVYYFPDTRTVLDVGGQTMKATLLGEDHKVKSFRLNDKCAAGTGAFLEKAAHYMGYTTGQISELLTTFQEPVSISGVCAVFAESEVINHLSQGVPPANIMQGAIESLVTRCVQLIKRVRGQPGFTLIGGILRFPTMAQAVQKRLGKEVNVIDDQTVQYTNALGAAVLARRRLLKLRAPQASRDTAAA
jgi:predicted CoA-substrate-specific enzyme activase